VALVKHETAVKVGPTPIHNLFEASLALRPGTRGDKGAVGTEENATLVSFGQPKGACFFVKFLQAIATEMINTHTHTHTHTHTGAHSQAHLAAIYHIDMTP
jgi:hypothetical protein